MYNFREVNIVRSDENFRNILTNNVIRFNADSLQDISETDLYSGDSDKRIEDVIIDLWVRGRN